MELLLLNHSKESITLKYIFTFQYGATSTKKETYKDGFLSVFTFQYGATSTIFSNKYKRGCL